MSYWGIFHPVATPTALWVRSLAAQGFSSFIPALHVSAIMFWWLCRSNPSLELSQSPISCALGSAWSLQTVQQRLVGDAAMHFISPCHFCSCLFSLPSSLQREIVEEEKLSQSTLARLGGFIQVSPPLLPARRH